MSKKKFTRSMFFIRSRTDGYLGISIQGHQAEFSTGLDVSLCNYNEPHAFGRREDAERTLKEDVGWYNSGPSRPQRGVYSLNNCEIIEVKLP